PSGRMLGRVSMLIRPSPLCDRTWPLFPSRHSTVTVLLCSVSVLSESEILTSILTFCQLVGPGDIKLVIMTRSGVPVPRGDVVAWRSTTIIPVRPVPIATPLCAGTGVACGDGVGGGGDWPWRAAAVTV